MDDVNTDSFDYYVDLPKPKPGESLLAAIEREYAPQPKAFSDDDWLTPLHVIRQFGDFDLDPCMPVMQPWQTAARSYTALDDGLKQPWSGRLWLNPPYSDMDAWIAKLCTHLATGACTGMGLYNARTETKWFFAGVWNSAWAVFFPKARFKFVRPDGASTGTGKMGSVITAYSEADAQVLSRFKHEGKFTVLRFRLSPELRTTWRRLVRFLMKQCAGVCTLEQLYALVAEHPKCATNPNWKAKVRQTVQQEARRVGPALYQSNAFAAL